MMLTLLICQIVAFSLPPLYFTTLSRPLRRVHFYVYISLLLLVGGFMGNVYALPLSPGISVSGGNLCYGAFMMASIMFVWAEKDAFILRYLVRLVFLVDLFNIALSFITQSILKTEGVSNPHGVPDALFEVSTFLIALGGILIILELLLLLLVFEFAKKRQLPLVMTAAIYILSFILVLVLDGIAFPFIAFGTSAPIIAIVFGGLSGKVLMAAAFSVPLALYIVWRRRDFVDYLEAETTRWRLLATSSAELIREIESKDLDLRRGDVVFRNAAEGLAIVDSNGVVLKANPAFASMLNTDEKQLSDLPDFLRHAFKYRGQPLDLRAPFQEGWRREVSFGAEHASTGLLSITSAGEDAEGRQSYIYSLTDIGEQKEVEQALEYLASYDQLTGLPNRRVLDTTLASIGDGSYALAVIDIDHFKDVNDSYGHAQGDKFLKMIADRLKTVVSEAPHTSALLCRIGGDEFAILLQPDEPSWTEAVMEKVLQELTQTIRIDDSLDIMSSATIGLSRHRQSSDRDALLEADAAMYEAKKNRRGSIGIYEDRLTKESQRKLLLALHLKNALATGALAVHYQPQFDAVTHKIRGVEALARWMDPELGVVAPSEFIPVAEATGLIETLGEYVLRQACQDGREWLDQGYPPITVSVNVSAAQLRSASFTSVLSQILRETEFPASHLEIEVTESSYIERESEVSPVLGELREKGISIAIDDFGTGYSSLSYLRDMPWSCVKIDRSFITNIPGDQKQASLVVAILRLAKVMSLHVVAEGVETKEQLQFLASEGCDIIQGYYFSKPVPKDHVVPWFASQKPG